MAGKEKAKVKGRVVWIDIMLNRMIVWIPLQNKKYAEIIVYRDAPLWKKLVLKLVTQHGRQVVNTRNTKAFKVPLDILDTIYKLVEMKDWFELKLVDKPLHELEKMIDSYYKRFLAEKAIGL